jgi:hypothetical protein
MKRVYEEEKRGKEYNDTKETEALVTLKVDRRYRRTCRPNFRVEE